MYYLSRWVLRHSITCPSVPRSLTNQSALPSRRRRNFRNLPRGIPERPFRLPPPHPWNPRPSSLAYPPSEQLYTSEASVYARSVRPNVKCQIHTLVYALQYERQTFGLTGHLVRVRPLVDVQ